MVLAAASLNAVVGAWLCAGARDGVMPRKGRCAALHPLYCPFSAALTPPSLVPSGALIESHCWLPRQGCCSQGTTEWEGCDGPPNLGGEDASVEPHAEGAGVEPYVEGAAAPPPLLRSLRRLYLSLALAALPLAAVGGCLSKFRGGATDQEAVRAAVALALALAPLGLPWWVVGGAPGHG